MPFYYGRHHDWVGLKFSQYMIIGDLVRSSSLPRLVQLMTMFREVSTTVMDHRKIWQANT